MEHFVFLRILLAIEKKKFETEIKKKKHLLRQRKNDNVACQSARKKIVASRENFFYFKNHKILAICHILI